MLGQKLLLKSLFPKNIIILYLIKF